MWVKYVPSLVSTYLRVSSIRSHDYQRAPTVSRTCVPPWSPSADHGGCYLVVTVPPSTLLVGEGGDIHLLENISLGTRHVDIPPPSHHGSHVLIVQGGVRHYRWAEPLQK